MANLKLNLTRDQLATFLKDHEQIKQFERLFATVDAIAPDFVNEVALSAGNAQATANDALALIDALENSLTSDGAVVDAKATLALDEIAAIKAELQLKALEPAQQHNNALTTDYLTINQNGHAESAVGRMLWDDGEGTVDLGLKGGNVTVKIGEQEYARAYNDTASTMTKGQVVYISGAQGNRVAVKLAQADSDANSAHTIGLVAETIAAGSEGWVQVSGAMYKLNTLAATAGDTVYLSPTVAGTWTTTKPVAPEHLVIVGFIERVSATVGSIYIKVDNGYELDELHNVKITSVANGDLLQYDSTGPFWKNVAISSLSIGTATNLAGGGAGSVPYQSAASTTTFLPIGTASQVLKVNAGATAPEWVSGAALTKVDDTNVTLTLGGTPASALLAATSLTLGWTGQLAATRGGTGQGTYTLGDTLYSSAANTLSKLAGNTTTTRQFLRQTGTGTVSAAPAWDTVTKTDVGLSNVENTALSTWAGSTNLTTLGTIASGTWQGSVIASTYGGTGVNNAGRTLTVNTNSGTLSFTNASTTLTIANTGSISGTNTGDQTITLTGDVTGSGTGSFATTIAAASTGTGNLVRANSPTLVTPALGTPSSGNFSTGTFTWPTFNQNTTGSAGSVANSVTFDNSGTGAVSGTTYNGSAARTISYNTIGAQQTLTSGTNIKTVGGISLLGSGDLGTIDVAYGGTGRNTGPTTGQILIGNSLGGWDYKTITGAGSTSVNVLTSTIRISSPIFVSNVNASFTGGLVSVTGGPIYDTGTLAFTVAGTSGGIPYFSSASTWASSGVLAANALMVGGGAGLAPATITTGTGVVTALGVNTGSAGAFVVNGGALGTPSSGTLTNCTGLPISTGVSGLGTGVATFLATPSSANLAAAVTGETGSGALVFGSSPTIDAPTISGITNLTGGQIQFPATQVSSADANTLDDYEEGTWTATIIGTTTAGTGTYTTRVGRYTKIGRVVQINCRLIWTAHTGTGNMQISGLPFTCENVAGSWFGVAFGQISNVALTANNVMTGYIQNNTAVINLQQYPAGGGASAAVPIDTAATLVVSATYQAAT